MQKRTWISCIGVCGVLLMVVFLLLASRDLLPSSVLFGSPSEREKGCYWQYFVDVGRKQTNPVPKLRYGFEWLKANATISVDVDLADPNTGPFLELLYFTQSKHLQITCPEQELMGGPQLRGGWDVCVSEPYNLVPPCLVYSIGMGKPSQWGFDRTVTKKYGCKDFAYDPSTGRATQKIDDLLCFFAVGLSGRDGMERQRKWPMKTLPTLLKENGHTETTIDILKIDIECSEWTSFDAILASPRCLSNVKQLMVEFHPCGRRDDKKPEELLGFWRTLRGIDSLGFKLWKVWNNPVCRFQSRKLKGVSHYGCHNAHYINIKYLQ